MTTESGDADAWVLAWFEKRGPVAGATTEEKMSVDYFAAGLIDSMAVVDLILEAEAAFGIRFNERHYQDRRFSTLKGLSDIISETKRGQG